MRADWPVKVRIDNKVSTAILAAARLTKSQVPCAPQRAAGGARVPRAYPSEPCILSFLQNAGMQPVHDELELSQQSGD